MKTCVRFSTRLWVALGLFALSLCPSARSADLVLEDDSLLVAFDSDSGGLARLENKSTHWTMERRPELAMSFRLHAPLPGRRDNFILGQKQRAAEAAKISPHEARFQWRDLLSEHGGTLPIIFTSTVTLSNGVLTFSGAITNHSPLTIETVDYPYFGDFNPPARNSSLNTRHMSYGDLPSSEIYPGFSNQKGYWGVDFPMQTVASKDSLFCLIQAPQEGLYVEMRDPTQPYMLEYTFEQHPGVVDSINSPVPQTDALSGLPVHLEFRTCHFVFVHPHSAMNLAPVVLRGYKGDWHAGVDLYKEWRATWFKPPHFPEWVRNVNAWQQLQINSPEQEYRVPYTNLISYGRECAANGVSAIQLVGWNRGGQDGGDPAQDTDPGLGAWRELHDAIAQIQAGGVKMILFAKLNWADRTTAWFTNELFKFGATDPFGIHYEQAGYSYRTPTQLAGINNHRRDIMDFASPEYRRIAAREFQKLMRLGSAGWLWDELCSHSPADYSFAANHGYPPPGYIYSGDIPLTAQLRAAADKLNPDFLFSGEGPQDWLMPYYLSYFRISGDSTPVCRYLDPQAPVMVAVTGFDDREMLNLILLDRYIISYEPYNFKGHLTDFPLTLAYGQKIDALRRRYHDYLWDGDFRDTLGANVSANGAYRHAVYVTRAGKRAVVVVNQETTRPIIATVELPHPGKLLIASPEQPEPLPATGSLQIPARSAAVLMEQ